MSERPKIMAPRTLDDKGRCCGRKPIVYKRPPHLFCPRCRASIDPSTGRQIPNWAWYEAGAGFAPTYPDSDYARAALEARDGR